MFTAAGSAGETAYPGACTGFEASLVLPRLWRHDAVPALFASGAVRMDEDFDSSQGLSPDIVRSWSREPSARTARTGTRICG